MPRQPSINRAVVPFCEKELAAIIQPFEIKHPVSRRIMTNQLNPVRERMKEGVANTTIQNLRVAL